MRCVSVLFFLFIEPQMGFICRIFVSAISESEQRRPPENLNLLCCWVSFFRKCVARKCFGNRFSSPDQQICDTNFCGLLHAGGPGSSERT